MGKYDAAENVLRELERMSFTDMGNVFEAYSVDNVLRKFSLEEIEERIEALKKEKEGIRIGDEVEYDICGDKFRFIVLVKGTCSDGRIALGGLNTVKETFYTSNGWCNCYEDVATKTGEHYDASYLLGFIRDDDEDDDSIDSLISELNDIDGIE